MTDDAIIAAILRREGSAYTDHPADRGGPTRYGITLATLQAWRKTPVTSADVGTLTATEASAIYADLYLRRPRYHLLGDDRLRALMVDSAVLHGPVQATKWLQQAAGAPVDGVLGPHSLAVIAIADPALLYRQVLAERIRFIGRLITNDPAQAVFAAGWTNRAAEFLAA